MHSIHTQQLLFSHTSTCSLVVLICVWDIFVLSDNSSVLAVNCSFYVACFEITRYAVAKQIEDIVFYVPGLNKLLCSSGPAIMYIMYLLSDFNEIHLLLYLHWKIIVHMFLLRFLMMNYQQKLDYNSVSDRKIKFMSIYVKIVKLYSYITV